MLSNVQVILSLIIRKLTKFLSLTSRNSFKLIFYNFILSKMSSCLPPYAEGVNPTFERLGQDRMTCKAKGCCWDNDINKGKNNV